MVQFVKNLFIWLVGVCFALFTVSDHSCIVLFKINFIFIIVSFIKRSVIWTQEKMKTMVGELGNICGRSFIGFGRLSKAKSTSMDHMSWENVHTFGHLIAIIFFSQCILVIKLNFYFFLFCYCPGYLQLGWIRYCIAGHSPSSMTLSWIGYHNKSLTLHVTKIIFIHKLEVTLTRAIQLK